MNVVCGVPCDSCQYDGRSDIVDRWFEGPVPIGLILVCGFCRETYLWMMDVPTT